MLILTKHKEYTMPAYTSFSGIDIIAVVDDTVIATLQGISYSITREKAPIKIV